MQAERWKQIEELYQAALAVAPEKCAAFLAQACPDDAELRGAQIVELRYFGGMSVEETAEALGVHPNTVIRDFGMAKVWLKRELSPKGTDAG
jgi:DNA-directed RNA polymerase specialized sigma24 family protein